MSSTNSAMLTPAVPMLGTGQPLAIDVRDRRAERRLGVLALLAVAIVTPLLPLSGVAAAVFLFLTATLVLAGFWWQGWLGGARRLTGISRLADGSWLLTDGRTHLAATLSTDCRVGSRWLWLQWHMDGATQGPRRRSMLLVPGDLDRDHLRRLGVRLRLESVCRPHLGPHGHGSGS